MNHIPVGLLTAPGTSGGSLKVAIVKFSELGTECWSPARFCGSECKRLDKCKAACKKTCKAFQLKRKVTWVATTTRLDSAGHETLISKEVLSKTKPDLSPFWDV
jgi:hypothetical protein